MATFNAVAFLRTKGTCRTTVRTDGVTATLQGLPKAYTAACLASLAESNEKVKVSLRQVEIGGGIKAKSSASLDGKDAGTFIRDICGAADAVEEKSAAVA